MEKKYFTSLRYKTYLQYFLPVLNYSFYPAIYVGVRNLLHSEILSTKTRYSLYGKDPLK